MKQRGICCILLILIVLTGCQIQPEQPEEQAAIPPAEEIPSPVLEKTTELPTTILSKLTCIGKTRETAQIMGIVTNIDLENEVILVKDITIQVNGMLVPMPKCEKYDLKPGTSTDCENIAGHYPLRNNNKVIAKLGFDSEEYFVECPNIE